MAELAADSEKLRGAAGEGKVLRRVGDADTSTPWTQSGGSRIFIRAPISDNNLFCWQAWYSINPRHAQDGSPEPTPGGLVHDTSVHSADE